MLFLKKYWWMLMLLLSLKENSILTLMNGNTRNFTCIKKSSESLKDSEPRYGSLRPLQPSRREDSHKILDRASLVAQGLGVCLPMQGTQVRALVWEDPTCRGAAGPVSHNY